jgi:hypothetical protein
MRQVRISEKRMVTILWIMPRPLKGRYQATDSTKKIILKLEE